MSCTERVTERYREREREVVVSILYPPPRVVKKKTRGRCLCVFLDIVFLTQLTRKGQSFVWSEEADMAFKSLKKAFTSAPILAHVDPEKPFIIEADASDFALGSILSQRGNDEKLHPVAFHSRKFDAAEINYEIHDKEQLAIVDSFTQGGIF